MTFRHFALLAGLVFVGALSTFLYQLSHSPQKILFNRVNRLQNGLNISHWFWEPSDQTLIDRYVLPQDIQTLKKLGFRHVRIPVEMTFLERPEIIQALKHTISQFLDQDIAVIISAFGKTYNSHYIKTEKADGLLEHLCKEVIRFFPPEMVFLQIANEPEVDDIDVWSQIQNHLLQKARQSLPNHTLLATVPLKYGSGEDDWGMITAFSRLMPSPDPNVIYTVHFYEPYFFTHQGADWVDDAKFIKHLAYPSNKENIRQVAGQIPPRAPKWLKQKITEHWDKEKLQQTLAPILAWRNQHQRPVMITEFGVLKNFSDLKSRFQWIADMVDLFQSAQLPWTYWDFNEEFGVFYRHENFRYVDEGAIESLKLFSGTGRRF
jgi:endoglucanase